jgi:hypothetical protein
VLIYSSMWVRVQSTIVSVRQAWVVWRPPQAYLHYPELYGGIYEYLRLPPSHVHMEGAQAYLTALVRNTIADNNSPTARLQQHRIQWVRAWLQALWLEDDSGLDEWTDTKRRKLASVAN